MASNKNIIRKERVKTADAKSPLKECGTLLLFGYLILSAIYEGFKGNLNKRKEYIEDCKCEDGDKIFYPLCLLIISITWIALWSYTYIQDPVKKCYQKCQR